MVNLPDEVKGRYSKRSESMIRELQAASDLVQMGRLELGYVIDQVRATVRHVVPAALGNQFELECAWEAQERVSLWPV